MLMIGTMFNEQTLTLTMRGHDNPLVSVSVDTSLIQVNVVSLTYHRWKPPSHSHHFLRYVPLWGFPGYRLEKMTATGQGGLWHLEDSTHCIGRSDEFFAHASG